MTMLEFDRIDLRDKTVIVMGSGQVAVGAAIAENSRGTTVVDLTQVPGIPHDPYEDFVVPIPRSEE